MKLNKIILSFLLITNFILLSRVNVWGQLKEPHHFEKEHEEVLDDPYIPVRRSAYHTTPAYFFQNDMITTYQVNVNDQGMNMSGDAANEPTIAVDPTNPDRIAIAWRQFDTIASNFRQAGYAFTLDGGLHWEFKGVIEPGVFRSDPCLAYDDQGTFFLNSLEGNANWACDVFKTVDQHLWSGAHAAYGGDKLWMTIDRSGGEANGNIYSIWSHGLSNCAGSFTYSEDYGNTFKECSSLPISIKWGSMTVGPNGEIYACGQADHFYVMKSENANHIGIPIQWMSPIRVNLGGLQQDGNTPNPDGLMGQVWIDVDRSVGPRRGNVYMLSTVANADPAEIMFARSTDGGDTWKAPVRINDDVNTGDYPNWNWFGVMSVAPNGRIDAAWLDSRDNHASVRSALYFSSSVDGGLKWSKNVKLSESFDPRLGYPNQNKIGDYYHMVSDNEGAHLAWAATFNGEQDVYYSRILTEEIISANTDEGNSTNAFTTLYQNYPNPFKSSTTISYTIHQAARVNLSIYDISGKLICTLVNKSQLPERYFISWNGRNESQNPLGQGVYIYQLSLNGRIVGIKKLVITS